MLLVPLPSALLDVALSLQLAFAVLVVLVCTRALSLDTRSVFPTLLLTATCIRLALNVSTTRLILARGDAGEVVRSFGSVAIADNLLAGTVIFLVIAIAQLLVVTRGAERIAEVCARFSLDAIPGQQMAIDADVRAGFIDAREARARRRRLARESRFYGAMDGAMRFVKGDALVALVIAAVNLACGAVLGVAARDMTVGEALTTYLTLAIGDGLAAQIPALLLAIAAGLAVTRSAGAAVAADEAESLLVALARPQGLATSAGLFAVMAAIPGLPTTPFAGTALLFAIAWLWARGVHSRSSISPGSADMTIAEYTVDTPISTPAPAPIAIEMESALADRLNAYAPDGSFAASELVSLRRWLCERLGMSPPAVVTRVQPAGGYRLLLRGVVIDSAPADELLTDPESDRAADARTAGAHLGARMRVQLARHAFELIDIQALEFELRALAKTRPELAGAVLPGLLSRPQLRALTSELVREGIVFGSLATLLQAVSHACAEAGIGDPHERLARVRCALRGRISAHYAPAGVLAAWRLDPLLEDTVRGALAPSSATEDGPVALALEPEIAFDITGAVVRALAGAQSPTVLLVAADVRRSVAQLIAVAAPEVVVLAPQELTPDTRIQTVATIGL